PLWKKYEKDAEGAGHGGMDYFVINAFVEAAKRKVPTTQDVYDAAAISAIVELSERSVSLGGAPQEFPDFTGGRWIRRKNVYKFNDEY
ncbi:MAG: gfo/Idh/MocA family oxidoreductase, partial [Calditrichaeota bacterium]|nr:gfo/Idh/MocA family oxidoreductase [Calditrichota bacterium]